EVIPAHDRRMILSEVGVANNLSSAYTPNSGPQDAVIKIQLTDDRSRSAQEYAVLLRDEFEKRQAFDPNFADLRIAFDTGGMVSAALNFGATAPIEIQVVGGKLDEAYAAAREIRDRVETVPGAADVRIFQRFDYPQVLIDINRKKANQLGLSVYDVFQTVTTALNSSVTVDRNFWVDPKTNNQYWVGVQYEEKSDRDLDEIRNIALVNPNTNEVVKLGTVVKDIRRVESAPAELVHDNLDTVVTVQASSKGRDIGGLAADIKQRIAGLELPKGMIVRMSGEYERMNESFGKLGFGLALASVLVYLLMVALFRSYLTPFIIMFAVPLGMIGVLHALYLTHTSLNVQSMMGTIFMVGIVVANSTLLVDFANKQHRRGVSARQAVLFAAAIRLRPILMTFLAAFLALLPMAIGIGKGSEANVPLARAVCGGLIAATSLTLFVVPCLYTLLVKDEHVQPQTDELEEGGDEGPAGAVEPAV
ncbi:MAG: efflux RND transporter permease subunit, partial [Gemmataceae bacterium]